METSTNTGTSGNSHDLVHDALKAFSNVMLLSGVHSRPMAIAKLEPDCTIWFITHLDSAKNDPEAMVIGQTTARHISMTGTLEVVHERGRVQQLWSKAYEVWFPNGPSDANAVALKFTPREAELWDSAGAKGLKYVLQAAKALVTGETPKPDEKQHTKTTFDN